MIDKRDMKLIGKIFASVIIIYIFFAIIVGIFHKDKENPTERNYIIFRHNSIEEVRDSLHSMQFLIGEMALPSYSTTISTIIVTYSDSSLKINDIQIGLLEFQNLKNHKFFKNYDKYTLQRFINLFGFLVKNDITSFHYYWKSDYISYTYKEYYEMYKTYRYDDHLIRFLVIEEPTTFDLKHRSLLDSTSGLYLLSYKSAKIWGDSIPYMKYEERELD